MAIQICSIHTCSYVPLKNVFQTFLLQVIHCQHQISFLSFTRDKCDKTSKASSRANGGADVCFLSSAVVQQHGAGAATRWTAAAFWSGAWRGATAQLGLADMAEQMLRMGGAGATLDLRGTRHPIWTSSPGGRPGKNGSSRSWVKFFGMVCRFVGVCCFLIWSAVGFLITLPLFSFHSHASARTNFS